MDPSHNTRAPAADIHPILLIPYLYAGDLPPDVEDEFIDNAIPVHCDSGVFRVTWGSSRMPETQAWLVARYGEEIKVYNAFAVRGT